MGSQVGQAGSQVDVSESKAGNVGFKLVPRPDFLSSLGQKKNLAFLATKMLARFPWVFWH